MSDELHYRLSPPSLGGGGVGGGNDITATCDDDDDGDGGRHTTITQIGVPNGSQIGSGAKTRGVPHWVGQRVGVGAEHCLGRHDQQLGIDPPKSLL